jgi:dihydrofolate reductase
MWNSWGDYRKRERMGEVIADVSMSLDGFIAGPNVSLEDPVGEGGEQLHEWYEAAAGIRDEIFRTSAAIVMGRRMFDVGVEPWGDDPPFHMPVFVVTHRARDPLVKTGGTTYTFVTAGIAAALAQARAVAGAKDIAIFGGADVIQQFVAGGLLDELRLHLAHLLLGEGTRLFDRLLPAQFVFESTRVVESPGATHIMFKVVKED